MSRFCVTCVIISAVLKSTTLLIYSGFYYTPDIITAKLYLLVTKSKNTYISKKKKKKNTLKFQIQVEEVSALVVIKGNGFFEISCFSLSYLYA